MVKTSSSTFYLFHLFFYNGLCRSSQVKDLLYFVVILVIIMMAFGILRQAISYPNEEARWDLLKHIFLKPYFMIYGEVYADEVDRESHKTFNFILAA